MSYTKHNFQSGDTLYASDLNAMEDQIAANETAIAGIQSAVADLRYVPVSIGSFSIEPQKAEIGSTVSSLIYGFNVNKQPSSAALDGANLSVSTYFEIDGNLSFADELTGLSLTSNKTYTLQVTDERAATDTKMATLSFLNRVYYGAAAAPEAVNSSFLLGLANGVLSDSRSRTFTVTAGSGEYIWYAVPARLGSCAFSVGGFSGGFSKVSTFTHTNASGYEESYDVYRSDNASLGATTVSVS